MADPNKLNELIGLIKQGVGELEGFLKAKGDRAAELTAALANQAKVMADNAAAQKIADDAVTAATVADQVAQQRIVDEVKWLVAELTEDPNAGPDPATPVVPPTPPTPPVPTPAPAPTH